MDRSKETVTRVLLVSGGVDSIIMAHQYEGKRVFVDYGQKYAAQELATCISILGSDIDVIKCDLDLSSDIFVPNRNLMLCSLVVAKYNPLEIFLAGLKDDHVSDKNPHAFNLMSYTLSSFTDRAVMVYSPYFETTKAELVAYFMKQYKGAEHVLQQTFSCYQPNGHKHCLDCPACLRRYVALSTNGVDVPAINKSIVEQYLKKIHTYEPDRISRTLIACKKLYKDLLCIDIDGTLCVESGPYENRVPWPNKINQSNNYYDNGSLIVLYTARLEMDRSLTEKWLEDNGVKYHVLITNKLPYDLLFDDKTCDCL